jgi:hypothetical protein
MKSVKVFIYSYKNKNLLDQLKDMMSKQSGLLNVSYYVFDQNNVNREFHFKDLEKVTYRFIRWDDYKSKTYYRNVAILNEDVTNYFFEVDPNVSLMESWDIYLSSVLKPRSVISGKGLPKLTLDRHLMRVNYIKSNNINTVNYIDSSFIFLKLSDAMMLTSLSVLKGIGQDLFASAIFMSNGFDIESLSSSAYTVSVQDNADTYVPYSVIHGYNKMLDMLLSKDNKRFEDFHGIKLSELTKMPYEIDDVSYLHYQISLENQDVPRFLSGYRGVQIL